MVSGKLLVFLVVRVSVFKDIQAGSGVFQVLVHIIFLPFMESEKPVT